ncbi:response regulator [Marixanthomonas ophiurae]|uniref:Response regulator n=1 Tax=Marixanthomonas ophiurae TaxID=387659 RepID=A0A3E1QB28_9FLAO|nr:response regulator [Marixanthomonas ophiurae]RFN59349.1 response regulator [Marixanthomonas ophiurae]
MKKIDLACIVDDDPIFVFGAKRMMQLSNFCNGFLIFNNGKDALNHLTPIMVGNSKEILPDIILLDLNMPVMDGWQFLDEFIKIKTTKKVIIYIVSSSIDPADFKKSQKYSQVKNFVIKPISEDKIKFIMEDLTSE